MVPTFLCLALQVENLLDNFTDPAEHQIAVECLVVISRIEDRNPELTLIGSYIDLRLLIKQAIHTFWTKWISEQNHQSVVTPFIAKNIQQVIETASNTPITIQPTPTPKQVSPIGISHVEALSRQIGDLPIVQTSNPLLSNLETPPIATEAKQGSDLSFERNDRLARRIFYDLWQDGVEGTMSYLATACVKNAFGVNWSSEKTQEVSGKILTLVCTGE